jgi:transposase-like protein
MKKEVVRRYSQAFKQQVVREYEAGASVNSLMQKYGIGGHRTVPRWIKTYSLAGIRSEVMIIQSAEDQLAFKAMKKHISELESALSESVLENRMLKSTLDVASKALEIDLKKVSGRNHRRRNRSQRSEYYSCL